MSETSTRQVDAELLEDRPSVVGCHRRRIGCDGVRDDAPAAIRHQELGVAPHEVERAVHEVVRAPQSERLAAVVDGVP
jgi:hypothetical protein